VTPAILAAATVAQALDPCAALATLHELAAEPARAEKCREVATAAREMGADPVEVVALAWSESKMNADAVSPTGVGGALQVSGVGCRAWLRAGSPGAYSGHPVRMVDGRACDVVAAGVWQWMRRRAKAADVRGAACAYNAGACPLSVVSRCAPGDSSRVCRGWRWAGTVAVMAERMRAAAAVAGGAR
jgi:hypothetical protein